MNSYEEQIKTLLKQPLFHLSLSSKELFHSNFIFWLSTLHIEPLRRAFGVGELEYFEREVSGNKILKLAIGENKQYTPCADLVGYNNKKEAIVVIENKVKDIPKEEQIADLSRAFPLVKNFILLSFTESCFQLDSKWKLLTYSKLIHSIESDEASFSDTVYHKEIIKDYVLLVKNLDKIISSLPYTNDYDFAQSVNKKLKDELEQAKLWQLYQRTVGQRFEKNVRELLISDFTDLKTHSSITTQKVAIDFYFTIKGFNIGVQIEDNQFRRYLHGVNSDIIAKKLISKNIWFNSSFKAKGRAKESSYCKFEMKDRSKFIYQYEEGFYKNCKMALKEIATKLHADLRILKDNNEDLLKILN